MKYEILPSCGTSETQKGFAILAFLLIFSVKHLLRLWREQRTVVLHGCITLASILE